MKKFLFLFIAIALISINMSAQEAKVKISGQEDVLFIVDGVVWPKDSSISNLDANDIESVSVLKGEAAQKEYGEDGVVLIETKGKKKGKKGKNSNVEVFVGDTDGNEFFKSNGVYVTSSGVDGNEYFFSGDGHYDFSTGNYVKKETKLNYNYHKSFQEDTFEKDYTINVDDNLESLSVRASGSLKNGTAVISIIDAKGKTIISALEIDEFGSVSISKKLKFQDNNITTGDWKLHVKANNATGSFKVSLTGY